MGIAMKNYAIYRQFTELDEDGLPSTNTSYVILLNKNAQDAEKAFWFGSTNFNYNALIDLTDNSIVMYNSTQNEEPTEKDWSFINAQIDLKLKLAIGLE